MSDNKFERCTDPADPTRCNGVVSSGHDGGQCPYKSVPGCTFCPMHGGSPQIQKNKVAELKNYRLTQYGERVSEFANNPEVKNIREEIGIIRMTIEAVLNECTTANKLLIYSEKISGLVSQVNKLVESSQRMEEKNNMLLDRKVVIVIADSIVQICADYIKDPDALMALGGKICESITNAASPTYSGGTLS